MKKNISKMAGVLVLALTLGLLVGMTYPTKVQAGPSPCPLRLNYCFAYAGGCGGGACGDCERPYQITTRTRENGSCCGTVVVTGCELDTSCPSYPCDIP